METQPQDPIQNNDPKHEKHHFWQKRHEKEKEIASKRGEAAAYATVGTLGAVAWAGSEGLAEFAAIKASEKITKNGWKNFAIAAGVSAVGGFVFAGIKHLHAEKLEDELKNKDVSAGHQI